MTEQDPNPPGKKLGQGMLALGFAVALGGLTVFFNGALDTQMNPNQRPFSEITEQGIREVMLERNRQGHYVFNGTINDVPVVFLLDTGATDVAVPLEIAEEAGLVLGREGLANTANGVTRIHSTVIDELKIGKIHLDNISASVTHTMDTGVILLGMSALRQIEFSQRGNTLTLRQH